MIDDLPKGKSIGAMQASLQWISTHTKRFIGAVMITIGDGEGFILIKKGTPEAYYYQHGSKVLRGKPAYDYFSTQDLLTFRLQKYNAEEYRRAFALFNGEQGSELTPASPDTYIPAISVKPSPEAPPSPAPPKPAIEETAYPAEPESIPEEEPEFIPEEEEAWTDERESPDYVPDVRKILESAEDSLDFSSSISGMAESTESEDEPEITADAAEVPQEPAAGDARPPPVSPAPAVQAAEEERKDAAGEADRPMPSPEPRMFPVEDSEVADLGWILRRNGVLAASVFSDGFSVVALGDADFEAVAAIAEDALRAAENIAAALGMGPFVQMTLQMEGKNVIIAPYRDTHICFLTSPKTHLGQIRGILQELALRNSR
jgi:predicted regulator of Ras-like GTPase activity (Roadblock/LC7/MglB family)